MDILCDILLPLPLYKNPPTFPLDSYAKAINSDLPLNSIEPVCSLGQSEQGLQTILKNFTACFFNRIC